MLLWSWGPGSQGAVVQGRPWRWRTSGSRKRWGLPLCAWGCSRIDGWQRLRGRVLGGSQGWLAGLGAHALPPAPPGMPVALFRSPRPHLFSPSCLCSITHNQTEPGGGAPAVHAGAAAAAGGRRHGRHGAGRPARAATGGGRRHVTAQQPAQAAHAPDRQRAAGGRRGAPWRAAEEGVRPGRRARFLRCAAAASLLLYAAWLTHRAPAVNLLMRLPSCLPARLPVAPQMLKVAALTWPKLVDWCRQLHARCRCGRAGAACCEPPLRSWGPVLLSPHPRPHSRLPGRDVVAGAPPVGCVEAEQAAKAALRAGVSRAPEGAPALEPPRATVPAVCTAWRASVIRWACWGPGRLTKPRTRACACPAAPLPRRPAALLGPAGAHLPPRPVGPHAS